MGRKWAQVSQARTVKPQQRMELDRKESLEWEGFSQGPTAWVLIWLCPL